MVVGLMVLMDAGEREGGVGFENCNGDELLVGVGHGDGM